MSPALNPTIPARRPGPVVTTGMLLGLLVLAAVTLGPQVNFDLRLGEFLALHAVLESASIVACLAIGLTAWFVVEGRRPQADRLLAVGFLLVAGLDLAHMLSYAGMPDLLSPNSVHKAIVFWLLARAAAVTVLLVWAWRDRLPPLAAPGLATAVFAALMLALAGLALWRPEVFPATFLPGSGLTPFKRGVEWLLIGLMLLALVGQQHRLAVLPPAEWVGEVPVRDALLLMAVAEAFFVVYSVRVTDAANLAGHVCKLAAHVLLFRGMFLYRVRHPFRRLALAHGQLAQRSAEHQRLIELAPIGIVVCDRDGRIRTVNRSLETMVGHARDALIGQSIELLLPPEDRAGHRQRRQSWTTDLTWPARQAVVNKGLRADGSVFDVEVALGGGETPEGWQLTVYVTDVSHRRAQQEALQHRALHDLLTDLPNRWSFAEELHRALAGARGGSGAVVVAVLDLDQFKSVNESRGAACGDRVLKAASRALSGVLQPGDLLARLGSDEFAVLVRGGRPVDALGRALAQALTDADVAVDSAWVPSAGIGLAASPAHADDADRLMRCAELALGEAKRQGRGGIVAYDAALGQRIDHEARVQRRLREALQQSALRLHYQPQIDVASGRIIGFEALLRWHDAELGTVSPAEFVPLAERAGLIGELGDFVLRSACAQLRHWLDAGLATRVAVNLSPRQFRQAGMAERIAQELRAQRLPGRWLAVEITESAVMDDPTAAAQQLEALRRLGIETHLDDFGTGHSSLAWLKALPIAALKIDRAFVREMVDDPDDEAIVRTVIGLAHALRCRVVAEGVETTRQLDGLRALGCDEVQGWLFSPAVSAEAASALLQAQAVRANPFPAFPAVPPLASWSAS